MPNISISHHLGSAVAISSLTHKLGIDILNHASISHLDDLKIAFSEKEFNSLKRYDHFILLCAFSAKESVYKANSLSTWNPLDFMVKDVNTAQMIITIAHAGVAYPVQCLLEEDNLVTFFLIVDIYAYLATKLFCKLVY